MKLLFDQGTPVPLRRSLPKHEVVTAFERGWGQLQNGELLRAAEAEGFTAIVTTDQNLRYQQHLADRKLAIVVLMTTNWNLIREHTDRIAGMLTTLVPGAYVELQFPAPGEEPA
jgi:predicted nuclease of predicted toxin-antitoxin system